MIVVEHDHIAIDYCPQCRGVWLDRGELELLVERSCPENTDVCLDDYFHRQAVSVAEAKRRCPICNRHMRKEKIGVAPEVIIDACADREDGLWFDGGELHQILSQVPVRDDSPTGGMMTFLRNALKADAAD